MRFYAVFLSNIGWKNHKKLAYKSHIRNMFIFLIAVLYASFKL